MTHSGYLGVFCIRTFRTGRLVEEKHPRGMDMIATEAALYGQASGSGSGVITLRTCGCGQEIGNTEREHCPRCGCCLN